MTSPARMVVVCLLLAAAVYPVRAASDLTGRVLFSGDAVPGATVTATRGDRTLATLTDGQGAFRFSNIDDGNWTLRIEMRGFVTVTRDVTLPSVEQALEFSLRMQPYEDIIRAIAPAAPAAVEAPQLNAVEVINGSVINGAATVFAQPRAFGNNRPRPKPRYTGGVTVVIGNSAWNARPFSLTGSSPDPSYGDVQLGFVLTGPLKIPWLVKEGPNTVLSYQHGVTHNATTQSALMPTSSERAGDLGSAAAIRDPETGLPFAGNVIPPNRISPQAAALLAHYPLPGGDIARGANYQAAVVGATTRDNFHFGMNKAVSNRTSIAGGLTYQRTATQSRTIFDFADSSRRDSLNAALSLTRRFSTRLSVRAGYEYTRAAARVTPFFADGGPPTLLFPNIADLRDATPQRTVRRTHAADAEASIRRGRHNIKAGGDVRWNAVEDLSQPDPRGTLAFTGAATGNAFADFLLGLPATSSIASVDTPVRVRGAAYSAYVNDDFRIGSGLTMNLGLRWEYEAPFTESAGRLANLDVERNFAAASPVLASNPTGPLTGASYSRALVRRDRSGFQPRLALSWRPVAGSSLIVRAGYGRYRNRGVYEPLALLLAQQPPFSKTFSVQSDPLRPLTLADPFPASVPSMHTFAIDPGFRVGDVHTWQASAQRDLPASLTAIVAYFGDRGTHLMQAFLPNTYPAGAVNPCVSCPAGFVYVTSTGSSLRNAGQFTLRRRLHNGFTATAQYTIAKSTDDAATFSGVAVRPASLTIAQNWLDLDAERGPSSFDQRHLVSFQAQYTSGMGVSGGTLVDTVWGSLFKDWTITAQLTAGSGLPLTPVSFTAVAGTGVVGVRPSLTGVSSEPTAPGSYVNPAAYTVPAPGTWGNAGRNSIRGPRQFALDMSLARVFRLGGRLNLEWMVTATNVLNRVTFANINTVINSPQFGLPTLANPMRRVQTTLRLKF